MYYQQKLYHLVRPKDTIFWLAKMYDTTVDDIMRNNPGINPRNLQIDSRILICPGANMQKPGMPPLTEGQPVPASGGLLPRQSDREPSVQAQSGSEQLQQDGGGMGQPVQVKNSPVQPSQSQGSSGSSQVPGGTGWPSQGQSGSGRLPREQTGSERRAAEEFMYDQSEYDQSAYDRMQTDQIGYERQRLEQPVYRQAVQGQPGYGQTTYNQRNQGQPEYGRPGYNQTGNDRQAYNQQVSGQPGNRQPVPAYPNMPSGQRDSYPARAYQGSSYPAVDYIPPEEDGYGPPESDELHDKMREVWMNQVVWTVALFASIAGRRDDMSAIKTRIMANPQTIAELFMNYFPEEKATEIANLLTSHLQTSTDLMTAMRDGHMEEAGNLQKKLTINAEKVTDALYAMNPNYDRTELEKMFQGILNMLMDYMSARLEGQYTRSIKIFDTLEDAVLAMADYLSAGIIQ